MCNTNLCPARLKWCPGTAVNTTVVPAQTVQCSGNGDCVRPSVPCVQDDTTCSVSCVCHAGWAGSDCALTTADYAAKQQLKTAMLSLLVRRVLVGSCLFQAQHLPSLTYRLC